MTSFTFDRNVSYDVLTGENVIATIHGAGRNAVTKSVSNRIGGLLQGNYPHIEIRGSDGSHVRLTLSKPNENGAVVNATDTQGEESK